MLCTAAKAVCYEKRSFPSVALISPLRKLCYFVARGFSHRA